MSRPRVVSVAALAAAACLTAGVAARAQSGSAVVRTWSFEEDRVNDAPLGFSFDRTGNGRAGRWVVWPQGDAPNGANVLAQVDGDSTEFRFPVAVADEPRLADVRLAVRCKPVMGALDQSCGLVFRYQDARNYYVARANALERNIRFYKVADGLRQQLAGWSGPVTSGVWHELVVEARGEQVAVFWDGQRVLEAQDQTFREPGRIGLWTKADSVTYFDDLRVEAFGE